MFTIKHQIKLTSYLKYIKLTKYFFSFDNPQQLALHEK